MHANISSRTAPSVDSTNAVNAAASDMEQTTAPRRPQPLNMNSAALFIDDHP